MILQMLRERHPVAALSAPWDQTIYDPTRSRLPRALLYGLDKVLLLLRGLFLARRFRANLVVCETVHHALVGLGLARLLGIACVWDSHGNGRLFYESLGKGRWATRLVTALETFVGRRVDILVTVSERDAAEYARMGVPGARIRIVPVCVQLPPQVPALPRGPVGRDAANGQPVLFFFGTFRYAPNREALEFVNERLAPFLSSRGIPCDIRVAGPDVPALAFHPSVRPLGFVPDLQEALRTATLCVVPVWRGVGTLTKVIDAMAAGTPVVLSEFAARGIPEVRPGVHAYVAATEDGFLESVVDALAHPETARAMARHARLLVEQGHDWKRGAGHLTAALADAVSGHRGVAL